MPVASPSCHGSCFPSPSQSVEFRFVPTPMRDLRQHVPPEIVVEATKAIRTHVDRRGHPIKTCTLIQRLRHPVRWDVPVKLLPRVFRASELLALACLSEQRFMEGHSAPHLNAAMFRAASMHIGQGDDSMSMTITRRGGDLRIGGMRFLDAVFQQPHQIEGCRCEVVNLRLGRAIEAARRAGDATAEAIDRSLEFFLLANSGTPALRWETCVMLSAMAFEQLLSPAGKATALLISETFAHLW